MLDADNFWGSGFDKAETTMDTSERLVWHCDTMVMQLRTTCKSQEGMMIKEST